jgi:hypothetical protein
MTENKGNPDPAQKPKNFDIPPIGGGTAPVSGVSAMSPTERVQYIQEIQKTSPLGRISDALKNLTLDSFGLAKGFFDKRAKAFTEMRSKYQNIREHGKNAVINQHIEGLTENVRGVERIKHELDPKANVGLVNGKEVDKAKGIYVDSNWSPKPKGQIE